MKNFLLLLILLPLFGFAQFTDNFSDGDFTQNPAWTGDISLFTVDNFQLKLNSSSGNDSTYLVTSSSVMDNTEWHFLVRLAFTPSTNNHPCIYLASDNGNLRGPLNGYFIKIGKDGTDNKRIYFYRQSGSSATEIFTSADNLATASNNLLKIKVTRSNTGVWNFYCDPLGGNAYLPQGSVVDATYNTTSNFGILCKYTSSNINKFYFDDFYVGPIIVDNTAPSVTNVNVLSSSQLEVVFDEPVEQLSAENTMHYNVNLGINNPFYAERNTTALNKVTLNFSSSFTQALTYSINIANISDLNGNTLTSQDVSFAYYMPGLHDVVFNELMADPSPPVGLPDQEYIELHNRTDFPINIKNWVLKHSTTTKILPDATIPPDSFIVLVTVAAYPEFSAYGNVAIVDGLSATALTNDGTTLVLYDNNNNIIHALSYTIDWYADNNKDDGGWALELIDPNNPCGGSNNWRASNDPSGGSPGRKNSILAANADIVKPDLLRIGLIDSLNIEVFFSERMSAASLTNPLSYSIDNSIGNPVLITPKEPLFESVVLKLSSEILPNTVYKITLNNSIEDCSGNVLSDKNFAFFGIPESAQPNDVVINEVLFNPPTNGVDYVEIYNRSGKIIDLFSLRLASKDTILNNLTSVKIITESSYLMFPEDYLVLSTNGTIVKSFYNTPNPDNFVNLVSLPSFNVDDGIVVIADAANQEIDMLVYEEKMHYPLLNSFKGVSLERIHFDRASDDKSNWHSASAGVGYGTPAYKNSQFGLIVSADLDAVSVYPDIFSPDNDGHNDVLNIAYKFEEQGYVCNMVIYDAHGRLIKNLVKNELLGTEGIFSWDGITESNLKASIGIYIIYIEVFDLQGNIKKFKKTTVLGGNLN
ncbi:MAG: lamin tail domain-containing protein [Bacteroidales bacterium]|nr:lamin tail domain-containing protein [Bacteroidales bacterium]